MPGHENTSLWLGPGGDRVVHGGVHCGRRFLVVFNLFIVIIVIIVIGGGLLFIHIIRREQQRQLSGVWWRFVVVLRGGLFSGQRISRVFFRTVRFIRRHHGGQFKQLCGLKQHRWQQFCGCIHIVIIIQRQCGMRHAV